MVQSENLLPPQTFLHFRSSDESEHLSIRLQQGFNLGTFPKLGLANG